MPLEDSRDWNWNYLFTGRGGHQFAEQFVQIQHKGSSFEYSNSFKLFTTLKGNKWVQIEPLNRSQRAIFFSRSFFYNHQAMIQEQREWLCPTFYAPSWLLLLQREEGQPWKPGWKKVFVIINDIVCTDYPMRWWFRGIFQQISQGASLVIT